MKLLFSLVLAAAGSAEAFAPVTWGTRSATSLYNSRIDSVDAIQAAVAASKTYGPGSPEARVAWDIVEEMDASDNSASYKGGVNPEECLVTEDEESDACKAYDQKLAELAELIEEQKPLIEKMKGLASEVQALPMPKSTKRAGVDSPELRAAMDEAKKAQEKFGKGSAEAKLAWEDVEEIASAGVSNALGGMLKDECLVETIDACEALEEVQRVVQLDKETSRYGG